MDAIETIMTRRSIRNFTDRTVSDEDLETILKAGMSGPSATNARDWSFLVIRDKDMLNKMADANGRPAEPLRNANVGILVCGDLERAFKLAPDYWVINGAIATQNMTLAAHALGIGSVWLGTYPQMERVQNLSKLFDLPETAVPHSILAFGYPDIEVPDSLSRSGMAKPPKPEFEKNRIHFETW